MNRVGSNDAIEITLQEARKSRGYRCYRQCHGDLFEDKRCFEDHFDYSDHLLVITPRKNESKASDSYSRSPNTVGYVGLSDSVVSKKSGILNKLNSWIRKRIKSKKGRMSESDTTRKADLEKRWSAFSIEDKYYVKSQLSIWFPCIFRHPTLSELEAALANMGTRILDKVSRFQIIELNPNLTVSQAARNHFRSYHQKCGMDKLDVDLIWKQTSKDSLNVTRPLRCPSENTAGSLKSDKILSQLTLISSKIDFLNTKSSNNSFLNAECNWRHSAMAGGAESTDGPSAQSAGEMAEFSSSKLEEMYDKKKYHVPDWFYQLVEDGLVIELLPTNTGDSEITSSEVKDLIESSRRIFLHIVPNCVSSDKSGHIFVSITEQECKSLGHTVQRKIPRLKENCQKDSSQFSLIGIDPTPNCSSPSIDESVANKTDSGSRSNNDLEELFPQNRVLSFSHNWTLVDRSIYNRSGLIRRCINKFSEKHDLLPETGRQVNSEFIPNNVNISRNTDSHPFRANLPNCLESDGGIEEVKSENVKKYIQHKQMISRILKLMNERPMSNKSRGRNDKSHALLKSFGSPVPREVITKSFIVDKHGYRRCPKPKLRRCLKNVRFADTMKLINRVTSLCNRAEPEVNKSNSADDDVDTLSDTSSSPKKRSETILDKNCSSLHREYFVPERCLGYDADCFTGSQEINDEASLDQHQDTYDNSFTLTDSDVTSLRRYQLRDRHTIGRNHFSLGESERANLALDKEYARMTQTQSGRNIPKEGNTNTFILYHLNNLDHFDQMNANNEHHDTVADLTGIPKDVQVSSSNYSPTTSGNFDIKQVDQSGKQTVRAYARGTFSKFVKQQWHSDVKKEILHETKSESGPQLRSTIPSNQTTNAKTMKYHPESSPFSHQERRSFSNVKQDPHKIKLTGANWEFSELQQEDYEIACANRRLGYNYICTAVDDYYKSFVSGEDKTAVAARKSYRYSKHAAKCIPYTTGGVRKVVVKSKGTPDDNELLALLIDRYLSSDDSKVVDITKPLNDLDSLLEYCSKITSADCLLGDSTLNILRTINDIISRFITLEDEKLALRVKDDFAGVKTTAKNPQKSGALQHVCRPHNAVNCTVMIDVATQTYSKSINDCEKSAFVCCSCRQPKDSAVHLILAKHCSSHAVDPFHTQLCRTGSAFRHLDETQNKLDSETDDTVMNRIRTSDQPVGETSLGTALDSDLSKAYGRPLSGELERLLALPRRQPTEGTGEYSNTLIYPAPKRGTVPSRNSPELHVPAFFPVQRLTSVGSRSASPAQDQGAFPRTRWDDKPLKITTTPASPPNLSDNHGSLASNENGTSFPKQPDDVFYRPYSGLSNGTDKLLPLSVFPQTPQEQAFRYGESGRSPYYDGTINQNFRPEQTVRMRDESYALPARESTGIQASKIFNLESTFNHNRRSFFERSTKQTESFAVQTDPNISCNRTNCPKVCTGGCLSQVFPARCQSHPHTCASTLPRNLECHCKPEVTLRNCMTLPPWRPRYRLCKNAIDDNLDPYLCQRNRIPDFPSSFLNFRPSLTVTPNARFCHRTVNDIFCDIRRENTSLDYFSDYRRKPAHDCDNFFERKLADKFPSCSARNSRYLSVPEFESAPETQRRFSPQRSELPVQVSDPTSASDIQQQTLALIGQVLNTLQANRKPPDVMMADGLKISPSSDGGSCIKPCKERRCLADPGKKCKKFRSGCPYKNCGTDSPSERCLQQVQVDAESRNFECEEISEQSFPPARMCTKSLQVSIESCGRQPAQILPTRRASVRNVGMASVQTCVCISKPEGECQCGCLSEKLVMSQRQCLCADRLMIDLPLETSVCPCTVKKHTCKQESSPCGENKCLLECNKNKLVQTSVTCQKVSCNKKCQVGKVNPVACTNACGSTLYDDPSLNAYDKPKAKHKWDQPLKQSRSSEICGGSDVSDCTSTVHRYPSGQRLTCHGLCQRKSPRINFKIPSLNYCDKFRPSLQNICDNIPQKCSVTMSPCLTQRCEDRKSYQQKYSRNINPCTQRNISRAARSFQSLLETNFLPVKAVSSVTNRDSRTEALYNQPDSDCFKEKSNRLKSCNSCGTRRDSSPRKNSFTGTDANNMRKSAWCECNTPKEDGRGKLSEKNSIFVNTDVTSVKPVENETEHSRPFVHIKYKSKKVISDKAGEARQDQPCTFFGIKGLAEQLKEQIDEIISKSRDLQQQAIQFNTGSPRLNIDSVADNRLTGCDNRVSGSDKRVTSSSYDARVKMISSSPNCDARAVSSRTKSVTGGDYIISNGFNSPRSEIKIRNSQVASSNLLGVKSNGTHPPQNNVMEVTDPKSLRIGQVLPSELAVLGDTKMASVTSSVEGEQTVIDMETRGSQDIIRFQTQREGNEGWSFYEVEVNDPKSQQDSKKAESSPNKNLNSNIMGNRIDIQNIQQLGNQRFESKLCASKNSNTFSDAFKKYKMLYKFSKRIKYVKNKVCPVCKKTYTIVPGFRPIVLGHCTNHNVNWNASTGEESQEGRHTSHVSRERSCQSLETFSGHQSGSQTADRMSSSLIAVSAQDNIQSMGSKSSTHVCISNADNRRTAHITPEKMQGVKSGANGLSHERASALKQESVAVLNHSEFSASKYESITAKVVEGDGFNPKIRISSLGNTPFNLNGDVAARTLQGQEKGPCRAHPKGQNPDHYRLTVPPLLRNKNLNCAEYHEISCEEHVSSTNACPNGMNGRMANQRKFLHCEIPTHLRKIDKTSGRCSENSLCNLVNNAEQHVTNDQSKMNFPKHQVMMYTAMEDKRSQCASSTKERYLLMRQQGVAVPNTVDRRCHTNSQKMSKSKLRNKYTAIKSGATQYVDKGITPPPQTRLLKTTIIEDFSDAVSTAEFSNSYKCQHPRHDSKKHMKSHSQPDPLHFTSDPLHFTSDPLHFRTRIITGKPTGTGSSFNSIQFPRSYRCHATQHDNIHTRFFDFETDNAMAETMVKHAKTSSNLRATNSGLENDVLLVQQAKSDQNHRIVVRKKVQKLIVEDNGKAKSTTRVAPCGKMTSGSTRKSQSADSAASSHGIEDLPTESWGNDVNWTYQENSTGGRLATHNNDELDHKQLIQGVWGHDNPGDGAQHNTVISDDRVITARPWREVTVHTKPVRNFGMQIDDKRDNPSVNCHLPVTRNSSSVVSQNITFTPRRWSAQPISDQTEFDVSTSEQFNDTLTSSECTTQFCRPWLPKDELVKWWNSPKGLYEGTEGPNDRLQVSSASHGDINLYHEQNTKHRIMTDPRIIASILGTDVTRRNPYSLVECKDSATLTDDIMKYLHSQNIQKPRETRVMLSGETPSVIYAHTESRHALHAFSRPVASKPGCSADVKERGHAGADLGDGCWRNAFVSCAELTEASDERVLLEGAFYTPLCADRGEPFDGFRHDARATESSLPFRLVLFARADGKLGTKIYGTFLRRLSRSDKSFKWKVTTRLPYKV